MKKLNILLALCVALVAMSCELFEGASIPDEQFEKKVIFTRNGFVETPLEYTGETDTIITLPISIGGTSKNQKTVTVEVETNSDILYAYNFDRYRQKESAYYKELKNGTEADQIVFEIINPVVTIESGKDFGLLEIKINLDNVDPYGRYVLPLVLKNPSEYDIDYTTEMVVSEDDGSMVEQRTIRYSATMINFVMANHFSGRYTTNGNLYDGSLSGDAAKNPMTGLARTLYATDHETCYLYAGNVTELTENFEKYFVNVRLEHVPYFDPDEGAVVLPEEGEEEEEEEGEVKPGTSVSNYYEAYLESYDEDDEIALTPETIEMLKTNYAIITEAIPLGTSVKTTTTQIFLKYTYTNLATDSRMTFDGDIIQTK